VYPPINPPVTTVEEACAVYDRAATPLTVDEEGTVIQWNLKINRPHAADGTNRDRKTATIHNAIVQAAGRGVRIFIIDFKGGEFTSYRT
jgi:hypothetical protein